MFQTKPKVSQIFVQKENHIQLALYNRQTRIADDLIFGCERTRCVLPGSGVGELIRKAFYTLDFLAFNDTEITGDFSAVTSAISSCIELKKFSLITTSQGPVIHDEKGITLLGQSLAKLPLLEALELHEHPLMGWNTFLSLTIDVIQSCPLQRLHVVINSKGRKDIIPLFEACKGTNIVTFILENESQLGNEAMVALVDWINGKSSTLKNLTINRHDTSDITILLKALRYNQSLQKIDIYDHDYEQVSYTEECDTLHSVLENFNFTLRIACIYPWLKPKSEVCEKNKKSIDFLLWLNFDGRGRFVKADKKWRVNKIIDHSSKINYKNSEGYYYHLSAVFHYLRCSLVLFEGKELLVCRLYLVLLPPLTSMPCTGF
jgi:hypothetical protein